MSMLEQGIACELERRRTDTNNSNKYKIYIIPKDCLTGIYLVFVQ